jgi:hypothetical protein
MSTLIVFVLAVNALWILLSINIVYQRGYTDCWRARLILEEERRKAAYEKYGRGLRPV